MVQVLRPSTPPSIYAAMMVYLLSFELIARMAQTSPYIPYEMGKYLFFILLVIGILKYRTSQWPALWMALALIPGAILDLSGQVSFLDMIFNFLGPLNVALAILFFKGKRFSRTMFMNLIILMIYPMVAVLAHAIFKAPDLGDVEFELGANMVTSGGFGSNQVSTGLGLASFLVFIFWINNWKLTGYRWLDTTLLAVFILQGLLTFSRGGMVTGFLGIFVLLVVLRNAKTWQIRKYNLPRIGKYLIPSFILIMGVFFAVNRLTDGMLLLRYQGETAGTVSGSKQKSLNTITSGRFDIFTGDIDLFLENPILGVGAGASKYLREKMTGVVAHVELSRLLGEHGLLGVIYFLILVNYGLKLPRSNPNPALVGVVTALFVVGVFTSFHAAMRTFVSPMTIGLSMVFIRGIANQKVKPKNEVNQTVVKL
ncbi:O-antigen ligase family protein [Algoriphagus aquatilis]